jgi:hypothetical protein
MEQQLLKDTTVLPVVIGDRKYATTEHYVLSSLIKDQTYRDIISSYPIVKGRHVFNYHDQEQYSRVIHEACNKFNEKKCRSIQRKSGKTIGSLARDMIKSNSDFLYKPTTGSFPIVIGVVENENVMCGYNLIGHSLLRMKHIVEKLPDLSGPMEYIFWKSHPEKEDIPDLRTPKTYRAIFPKPKTKKQKQKQIDDEETSPDYFYEPDDNDEDYNVEEKEEEGYNPDEIPVYRNDRVRWIATNANFRLDDLRGVGAQADFLYATDAPLTDPFQTPDDLYSRTDPLYIFKIYKAAEKLVEFMKNGMDIRAFMNKSVDAVLWECKVSPELFGIDPRSLDPKQRHTIYVEYWHKFMSKTIPYYSLIEKEIMYPQNLAGFIRKEYVLDLNEKIGEKIKEILFASFIYQVIERSYKSVAPELRTVVMTREIKKFTEEEFNKITNDLYHLFFQGKFNLDEEGTKRIMLHESYRLSAEDIENALHFVPCKIVSTPALEINGTILDPMARVDIQIDNNVFHDLYQYIFYRLFIFYGSLTQTEAYQHLFHNGKMMDGNDSRLQKTLDMIVKTRRTELIRKAYAAKQKQYPQVQEMLLYAKATKKPINGEELSSSLWNEAHIDPIDLELMKWVVNYVPTDSRHYEKSIHLYTFLHDLVRSLNIMKSIVGKKLQRKSLDVFVKCFYHKLGTISKGLKVRKEAMPNDFFVYIKKTKTINDDDIEDLWRAVQPFISVFRNDKFVPSKWFEEAKMKMSSLRKSDFISAMSRVVKCMYPEQEVSNDQFYLITQIISGKDDIPMWPDPSFEMIREIDDSDTFGHLPEEIRKRIPKSKSSKKKRTENVKYNIVHPSFFPLQKDIQKAFDRPAIYDPVVSRASYALAALQKETIQPRRIVFFM